MKKNNKYKIILFLALIALIGAILGFLLETTLYSISAGYFIKRGKTFGPWLPMFAVGSLLITLATYKLKNKPLLVFLVSAIMCGIFEYLTGYYLLNIKGIRLWNYSNEAFNYGNIDGFVCLKSITFFGLSGLLIIYAIIPLLKKIESKMNKYMFNIITIILFLLFVVDVFYNYFSTRSIPSCKIIILSIFLCINSFLTSSSL